MNQRKRRMRLVFGSSSFRTGSRVFHVTKTSPCVFLHFSMQQTSFADPVGIFRHSAAAHYANEVPFLPMGF